MVLAMVRSGGGVYPEIKEPDYLSEAGEYRIDAAIYDWNTVHCIDYLEGALSFGVYPGGSNERHGVIALNGTWAHATPVL